MNTILQFVLNHSLIALAIPVIIIARIWMRDIRQANKFIDEINAKRLMTNEIQLVDRRSPNRAKNVIRPVFGQVVTQIKIVPKTGTHD